MYRQRRLHSFALYAAILALLAMALVPTITQTLRPVVFAADAMAGCSDPAMPHMHHSAPDAGHNGNTDSCPMCSLACHVPTLPALQLAQWVAPLALMVILQPAWRTFLPRDSLFTPPARGPPAWG